ncbi:MAG: hypothetical protein PHG05_00375 [Candidatus Nanoarchaeia archaeon]|nr:hypothetical protein [Candidatus Nanoarchaeia archaeon]
MEQKIIVKAIIEILGLPKEHVEESIKKVVETLKERFKVKESKIYESQEVQSGKYKLWTAFLETEIQIEKYTDLISLCFDFMPSSIEILEPLELKMKSTDYEALINDLIAKLHQYDMVLKKLNAENRVLKQKSTSSSS